MEPADLTAAWFKQAQIDAEEGVIECRMCRKRAGLDATTTLWRNGNLIYALCDECACANDVVFTTTDRGVEIRARRRSPLVVGVGM
jgi:hypothetical protein